jgi:hypothetical protein
MAIKLTPANTCVAGSVPSLSDIEKIFDEHDQTVLDILMDRISNHVHHSNRWPYRLNQTFQANAFSSKTQSTSGANQPKTDGATSQRRLSSRISVSQPRASSPQAATARSASSHRSRTASPSPLLFNSERRRATELDEIPTFCFHLPPPPDARPTHWFKKTFTLE